MLIDKVALILSVILSVSSSDSLDREDSLWLVAVLSLSDSPSLSLVSCCDVFAGIKVSCLS